MRTEVEERARWLLGQETTRSMSAGRLRERLVEELGEPVASEAQLIRELSGAAGFVVLDAPGSVVDVVSADWLTEAYEKALRMAMAGTGVRVLLSDTAGTGGAEGPASEADAAQLMARAVLDLSAHAAGDDGLRQALIETLALAEQMGRTVDSITKARPGTDSSTTPLRDPPPRRQIPLPPPQRSSRRPRREECR
jgi:hypothetical protein